MDTISPEKIRNLLAANRVLSSTLDFHELLRQIIRLAAEVVDAETASILLYDECRGDLYFDVALSAREGQLKTIRIPLGQGIAGWVARERTPLVIEDAAVDPRWSKIADKKTNFTTRSMIAVPLVFQDALLGVIEGINKKSGSFTAADADLFDAFAAQAAVAIENARLFNGLQEEKGKLQTVFSQMSDGAVFVDAQGRTVLVNEAARALVGDGPAAAPTLADIFAGFKAVPALADILSTEQRVVPLELSRISGKALQVAGIASRVVDHDGRMLGLLFIFRDVTALRKEEMIKRNFLSLISHKLKTPLVAITGYGPMLLHDDGLADEYKKIVGSIHRQGMVLSSLVDKLLYFTMVESGTLTLALTRVTMGAVVDSALTALKTYSDEHAAHILVHESIGQMPEMTVDSDKMSAVVRNLVENAIKFNRSSSKTIAITARRESGRIGIAVADNGPGIPPEERLKIFDKFYQIEESFTGQVEGAGLGLALVKQVVEAHGGTVGLENTAGGGTTFYLMIPQQC